MKKWNDIITKVFPELNQADLEALEAQIGAKLPGEYREFLTRFNGGGISYESEFPISEYPHSAYLNCLWPLSQAYPGLGIKESRLKDIGEQCYNPAVLRIGDDGGCGFWFIGMLGEIRGKVFYAYKEDYWSATICADCAAGQKQPDGYGFVCDRFDELPTLIFNHRDPE